MPILLVGANHKSAPLELRERLAQAVDHVSQTLQHLCRPPSPLQETVLLSTCNRVEVYAVTDQPALTSDFLTGALLGSPENARFLYVRTDQVAIEHLCAVAAGLDSLVLGETQILGQVKEAVQTSLDAGAAGTVLTSLFRSAVRAGKRVRTETAIGRQPISISSVAVTLATHCLGSLAERSGLVIGSGEMSKLAIRLFQERGGRLLIANRTDSHAQELAQHIGGSAIPFQEAIRALSEVDFVISATSAPQIVLSAAQITETMRRRAGRPLLLIDLAVPRDIDPAARAIDGVQLYNIDDLRSVREEHRRERVGELPRARAIIRQETDKFMNWLAARQAVPLINELHARAEQIRQGELARALPRLATLTAHDKQVIEALSRRIVNKLLHEPTVRLKDAASSNGAVHYDEALRELFGLNGHRGNDRS